MAIKSDIRIISRVVPRERDGKYVPRSVTIIQGGGGGGDVTNADHANSAYTLDEDTPVQNWFLSALKDDEAQGIINFLKGLKIAGNLINRIVKQGDKDVTYTDEDVMSALRVMTEIENSAEKLKEIFLRKNVADSTKFLLSMFAGAVFGKNGFASGLTGFGAKIFDTGHGEFESMFIRRFLEVPELRYNRVMVTLGDKWRAPGAGIIETVDTGTKTCTLKLEDGEIGAVAVGDICMGIYHNITGNATEDYDDGKGNRRFAGFCTVYFTITEVTGERNETFKYQLRPTSSSWSSSFDPFEMMTFVAYGNFTNAGRQTSVYETRTYTRMLWKQNTWEISAANVALQYGDLSNLNIFGLNMDGYSMYLNNIYMTGIIKQIKPDGTPVQTLNFREEGYIPGVHYDYYDSLSYNGSMWACINEDGSSAAPGSNGDWLEIASKGDTGTPGAPGKDGVSVTNSGPWYSGLVVPKMSIVTMGGSSFLSKVSTTNPPLWCWTDNAGNRFTFADGGYVLTGEVNTAEYDVLAEPGRDGTDGINGTDGVPGTPGKDGKTYYTWIRYADDAQGNGISNDPTGKAYIGLAYNKETAVESNNPSDYKWSDIKGEPGVPGAVGADGKTYYTWIAYSDNADGSGMYQQPNDNTKYIGIAVNKETATESSNPADYTWSQFKGDKGDGYTQMGQFRTGMVVPKMGVVSMGGGSYVAKVSTTNPPLWCWTDNAGNRFTFNDGGYSLTGEINTDEYELLAQSGKDGSDGTSYERVFIHTTTESKPATPSTSQTDDYVPSGWHDDPVGVSSSLPYEWISEREKKNGIWSEFSAPALWAKYGFDGADGAEGVAGTSIIWKGDFSSAPSNPQNGWAYKNTTDKKSYVYQDGQWYQMTIDGIDGKNGKDGLSIVWKGDLQTPPSNPQTNWAYRDTNNGRVYIWNGTAWALMVVDGSDGADGAAGSDGLSVFITYNDSTSQPSVPTGNGTTGGWHTNATSTAIWMSQKVAASASDGAWGTPIKIKGDKGDGYTQMGQFRTGMVVPKMGVVSMGGGSYVAKVSTTNPPLWCWTDNAGNRFTFNDGGYCLTGEQNAAEYDVWAEKGDTGAKGDKGDDGEKGDKGDKGDQGVQGIQGCIIRSSEWASGVTYRNDEDLTSGTRYIDIVMVRNNSAVDGWDVYKCIKTHTSSSSITYANTTYWTELSNVGPIYTSLIISKNASLDFVQGNELLIKDANNNIVAGFTGGSSKEAGTTPIRIWAGGKVPGNAPFRVDQNGNLVATKANIGGTVTATLLYSPGSDMDSLADSEGNMTVNPSTQGSTFFSADGLGGTITLPPASSWNGLKLEFVVDMTSRAAKNPDKYKATNYFCGLVGAYNNKTEIQMARPYVLEMKAFNNHWYITRMDLIK